MSIKKLLSLVPAMEELERAIKFCSADIDDIPFKIIPVIQSQGKKKRCAGWFSPDQWSTREGEMVHELTLTAELLNRDPVDIIATIRHEIVHVWCHFLGLKDTSTGGRHNKIFAEYAGILDLDVQRPAVDSYGLGYTTPNDDLRERIEKEFKPDVAAFNLFRVIKTKATKVVKTNAWICGCEGVTARIPAKKVMNSTCHECDQKWEKKLTDEEQEILDALKRAGFFDEADGTGETPDEHGDGEEVSDRLSDLPELEGEDGTPTAEATDSPRETSDVDAVPKPPRTRRRNTKD